MIEAHGKALAIGFGKIEIDDRVAAGARLGLDRIDQRHAIASDDIANHHRARGKPREVDAEPLRQCCVDINDAAVGIG